MIEMINTKYFQLKLEHEKREAVLLNSTHNLDERIKLQDVRIQDTHQIINQFESKLKEQRDYLQKETLSNVKIVSQKLESIKHAIVNQQDEVTELFKFKNLVSLRMESYHNLLTESTAQHLQNQGSISQMEEVCKLTSDKIDKLLEDDAFKQQKQRINYLTDKNIQMQKMIESQ